MVKVITYILGNNAAVQALVGTKPVDDVSDYYKVYPGAAPQSATVPYYVVRLIGRTPVAKNCDPVYTVQVISYATSYDEVSALNDAAITAIQDQAAATINGQGFGYANLTNEQDDFVKEHQLYAKITTYEGGAS